MTDILLLYFFLLLYFPFLSFVIGHFLSNVIIVRYTYSHVLPSKNRGPTNGSSKYNVQQHFRLIINAVLFARHDMTTGASNMKFLNPNYAMDDVLCYDDVTYVCTKHLELRDTEFMICSPISHVICTFFNF